MMVTGEGRWCPTARVAISLFAAGTWGSSEAQSLLDKQEQLWRSQRLEQNEIERRTAAFESSRQPAVVRLYSPLPKETPCFPLQSVKLEGERVNEFAWLQRYLDRFVGQCAGRQGLEALQRRASNLVILRGFVTARVGVPAQDLSGGQLRMLLVPGTVRQVRFTPGSPELNWRWAFPLREGDLLDLRAIEQGLEQIKRVSSHDVSVAISPSGMAGESDVVLDASQTRRWHLHVDASDAGHRGTGRYQGNLSISIDSPLGLNDVLSIGTGHSLFTQPDGGSASSGSAAYSVPWGWWTLSGAISTYRYRQWIEGFGTRFRATGTSTSSDISVQRLIKRGTSSKTSIEMRLTTRNAHSYIEGVEVGIHRQRVASAELAMLHRHYIGLAKVDLRLGHRRGTPWFGSQWLGYDGNVGFPTNRYGLTTLEISVSRPLKLAGRQLIWDSHLHFQRSTDHLPAAELVAVGGRYTVRGFDGEQTLAGERGGWLRNTLALTLGAMAPYLGIDAGWVSGPSARKGRRHLAGGVFGLRGSGGRTNWDLFAGGGIHAPPGFDPRRPVAGFRMTYQY